MNESRFRSRALFTSQDSRRHRDRDRDREIAVGLNKLTFIFVEIDVVVAGCSDDLTLAAFWRRLIILVENPSLVMDVCATLGAHPLLYRTVLFNQLPSQGVDQRKGRRFRDSILSCKNRENELDPPYRQCLDSLVELSSSIVHRYNQSIRTNTVLGYFHVSGKAAHY